MKNEIVCGVRRLPKATESNTKNGRQNAQEAQEQKSHIATFTLFRGYSVNVNPAGQFGFEAGKIQSNQCRWSSLREKICKYLRINHLQFTSVNPSQSQSK